jgi:hypothetical protein
LQGYALDQLITEMYIAKVEAIKGQLLQTYGYEEDILDCAVLKYQHEPQLFETLRRLKDSHKDRAEAARASLD